MRLTCGIQEALNATGDPVHTTKIVRLGPRRFHAECDCRYYGYAHGWRKLAERDAWAHTTFSALRLAPGIHPISESIIIPPGAALSGSYMPYVTVSPTGVRTSRRNTPCDACAMNGETNFEPCPIHDPEAQPR